MSYYRYCVRARLNILEKLLFFRRDAGAYQIRCPALSGLALDTELGRIDLISGLLKKMFRYGIGGRVSLVLSHLLKARGGGWGWTATASLPAAQAAAADSGRANAAREVGRAGRRSRGGVQPPNEPRCCPPRRHGRGRGRGGNKWLGC
jgi:hypothetical protein